MTALRSFRVAVALTAFAVHAHTALACSASLAVQTQFGGAHVLEGRVVGFDSTREELGFFPYSDALDEVYKAHFPASRSWSQERRDEVSDSVRAVMPQAGAVLIEPVDIVHAPDSSKLYAVLHGSGNCMSPYLTEAQLRDRFNIGDTLYVYAASFEAKGVTEGATSIRTFLGWSGLISRRQVREAELLPEPWPLGEQWSEHRAIVAQISRFRWLDQEQFAIRSSGQAEYAKRLQRTSNVASERVRYEYQADLARLHHAASPRARVLLLLKIRTYTASMQHPFSWHFSRPPAEVLLSDLDFYRLAYRYLCSEEEAEQLRRELIARELPVFPTPEQVRGAKTMRVQAGHGRPRANDKTFADPKLSCSSLGDL